MWTPKPFDASSMSTLSGFVQAGSYVVVANPDHLPDFFQNYAEDDFRFTIFAASGYKPPEGSKAPSYAPNGTVFLARTARYCNHNGTCHLNIDDQMYWGDAEGHYWRLSSKDSPDHYAEMLTGTCFTDASGMYPLPLNMTGSLQDFGERGGTVDFRAPFPQVIKPAGEK